MTETIIHVPHSSIYIPLYHQQRFVRSDKKIKKLSAEIADRYVDKLFNVGLDMLVFPVSRLAIDVERYTNPEEEIMAKRGLGVIYSNYYDGLALRDDVPMLVKSIEMIMYKTHHMLLTEMVKRRINKFGQCTIIDAHSFCKEPFPMDVDQDIPRPDICIGTDTFHTPEELKEYIITSFINRGYSVKENSPYAGTIVPTQLYKNPKVHSIMIEINKSTYMYGEEINTEGYLKVKNAIRNILEGSMNYVF